MNKEITVFDVVKHFTKDELRCALLNLLIEYGTEEQQKEKLKQALLPRYFQILHEELQYARKL